MANLAGEAKNPTKDIPRAMIWSTIGVAVLYGFMAIIAAGVLPIQQVDNQTLTLVAERILPKGLYLFFIMGGAWMALISTLNNQLASVTKPLMQACSHGWFPKSFARLHKKYRTPAILLVLFYIVGFLPTVFNLDIGILSKITTTVGSVSNSMVALSLLKVSKVMPKHWKKSPFYISDGKVKVLTFTSVAIFAFQAVLLGTDLSLPLLLGNIGVVIFAFIFANLRYSGVDVEISY